MNDALKTISLHMAQELLWVFEVNPVRDTYTIMKSPRGNLGLSDNLPDSFSGYFRVLVEHDCIHPDDISTVVSCINVDYLHNHFMNNTGKDAKLSFAYRRRLGDEYKWVVLKMMPGKNYSEDNAVAYLYIQDINDIYESISHSNLWATAANVSVPSKETDSDTVTTSQCINALSSIYMSMHVIDIRNNRVTQYSASRNFAGNIQSSEDALAQIHSMIRIQVEPRYRARALSFTNLNTLPDRMNNNNVLSVDLIGQAVGWFRMQFIAISRSSDGSLETVFFTTQVIDNEKKREENLVRKSRTDDLTGMYNRHAFELDAAELRAHKMPTDFVILSVDVNELKKTNDTIGHEAGDELICGAAECLTLAIGNKGRIYRTGGDEFMGLLFCQYNEIPVIENAVHEIATQWKGKLNTTLSLSCGTAAAVDFPEATLGELSRISDQRMYEDKNEFYRISGHDRRRY